MCVRTCLCVCVYADNVTHSSAYQCGSTAISANVATGCVGIGSGSASYGVYAGVANSCYGQATIGYGLYANFTANGCYGYSTSNYGLDAAVAIGCYGYSYSGTGLAVYIANSCYGNSQSISYKYNMP